MKCYTVHRRGIIDGATFVLKEQEDGFFIKPDVLTQYGFHLLTDHARVQVSSQLIARPGASHRQLRSADCNVESLTIVEASVAEGSSRGWLLVPEPTDVQPGGQPHVLLKVPNAVAEVISSECSWNEVQELRGIELMPGLILLSPGDSFRVQPCAFPRVGQKRVEAGPSFTVSFGTEGLCFNGRPLSQPRIPFI